MDCCEVVVVSGSRKRKGCALAEGLWGQFIAFGVILNASRVPTSRSAPGGRGFSRNSRNRSRNCGRSSRAGKRRGRGWGRANSETEAWECI